MKEYYVVYHAKIRGGTESRVLYLKAENKGDARNKFLANPPKDYIKVGRIGLVW